MSVESSIYTALKSLVSNRVYRDLAPDNNTTYPVITFQQVGGQSINFLEGGPIGLRTPRFQVNCWGGPNRVPDRDTIAALSRQVEDALRSYATLQTTVLGEPVAIFEEEDKRHGTMQDFSFATT